MTTANSVMAKQSHERTEEEKLLRYRVGQRIVHAVLATSFLMLLFTGLMILWQPLTLWARDGTSGLIHRIGAVLTLEGHQPRRDLVERFLPGDLFPTRRRTPHRPTQPVGILVDILEAQRLRTDMPAAERVLLVAADGEDLTAAQADLDAADRLTKVAGAIVGVFRGAHGRVRIFGPSAYTRPRWCRRP